MKAGLIHALDIALSGAMAAETQTKVAADNIANVNTPEYAAKSVILSERLGGGVQVDKIEAGGEVNLEQEMTNLINSQRVFQASVRVIDTIDEMLKTTIDMVDSRHRHHRDEDAA